MVKKVKSKPKKSKNSKNIKKENKEIKVIITAAAALLLELCAFGILGTFGGWVKYAEFGLFGLMAYIFPIAAALAIIFIYLRDEKKTSKIICSILFFLCLCAFIHLLTFKNFADVTVDKYFTDCASLQTGGGIFGGLLALGLYLAVAKAGTIVILVLCMIICLLFIFEVPVFESIKLLFTGIKSRENNENKYEEPDKVVVPRSKAKKEETVYEGKTDDGVTIRIVKAPSKKHMKAPLKRSYNKAAPIRDGSTRTIRSGAKAKGIINPGLISSNTNVDEMHEITHMKAVHKEVIPEEPKKTIQVTDMTETEAARIAKEMAAAEEIKIQEARMQAAKMQEEKERLEKERLEKERQERENQAALRQTREKKQTAKAVSKAVKADEDGYVFPPLSLLSKSKGKNSGISGTELKKMAENLEKVLGLFGATAKVIDMQAGPTVTRFELQPEMGIRVNKFTALADDLKLNLAVPDIRIEAPIPGRAAIGIEIPNNNSMTVYMRDLLEDKALTDHQSKIAVAAGVDISGNVVVADIDAMPHLLVAGTTGSGKSVFTKSLLMTVLFRAKPTEVGIIIIDPKRVEFNAFNGIPHMMKEVVTDAGQAVSTLRWAVNEMTNRYTRMQLSGVNDIKSYNYKLDKGLLNPEEENPKKMQQIIIVIDELADLMMTAAKEVESLIVRLAQLARAAGIHLIIATQRPSANVVTGLIKANVPSKAALRVSSGLESRIILDMKGAEELIGHGDMLFHPNGMVKPIRVQGAFVSEKEVDAVTAFLKENNATDYYAAENQEIQNYLNNSEAGQTTVSSDSEESNQESKYDDYLFEAGILCIEMGKASSSMLQRRFSIGFNRAARIIDQLTEMGAVGPANGAKPREILVDTYTFEEMFQAKENTYDE